MSVSLWEFLRDGARFDPMARNYKIEDKLVYQTDIISFNPIETYSYDGKIEYLDYFSRDECTIDGHVVVKTVPQSVRQSKIIYWKLRLLQTSIMIIVGGVPSLSAFVHLVFRKVLYGSVATWFQTALMVAGFAIAILGAYRCVEAKEEEHNWKSCVENYEGGIARDRLAVGNITDSAERFLHVRNMSRECIAFSSEEVREFWNNWVKDFIQDYQDFSIYRTVANKKSIIDNFFRNNPFQGTSLMRAYLQVKKETADSTKTLEVPREMQCFQTKFEFLNEAYMALIRDAKKQLRYIVKIQKKHLKDVWMAVDDIKNKIEVVLKNKAFASKQNEVKEVVTFYQNYLDERQTDWRHGIYKWAKNEKAKCVSVEQLIEPITEFVKAVDKKTIDEEVINALPVIEVKKMASTLFVDKASLSIDVAFQGCSFDSALVEQFKNLFKIF
jgi:hypothetical protein